VDTADVVLVAHKDQVQHVKRLVSELKAANRPEPTWYRKAYRPWSSYDSIDVGDHFQVMRITVKPGSTLSLQMHHHRAEHWIASSARMRTLMNARGRSCSGSARYRRPGQYRWCSRSDAGRG